MRDIRAGIIRPPRRWSPSATDDEDEEGGDSDAPQTPHLKRQRREKSLGVLSKRFVQMLLERDNGKEVVVSLDAASQRLAGTAGRPFPVLQGPDSRTALAQQMQDPLQLIHSPKHVSCLQWSTALHAYALVVIDTHMLSQSSIHALAFAHRHMHALSLHDVGVHVLDGNT